MRILIVVSDASALAEAEGLSREIREFNRGVDFRLRFLHVEIEDVIVAPSGLEANPADPEPRRVDATRPLDAAAALALLVVAERPDLLVAAGRGALLEPAAAAARASGCRLALYGRERGREVAPDGLDLGAEPATAVERMTGVAREIG